MSRNINPEKKQMMLEENVRTLIPRMAVPTIIAQMITTIYNLVDTYFVSTLGTNATAAVGVNSSLERMITIIGSLIGAGACSYIARLLGAKKEKEADRVLSTSFLTGAGLGIVFLIVGRLLMSRMVFWLGATEECATYSMQYANYVLLAAPAMIGSFILNMCLRSEGSATYAMIGIGFGGILNCFLDPLFIYKFGLGVAGASMATAISKYVSFIILLVPYLRRQTSVTIAFNRFRLVAEDVKEVVAIGSSSFFRSALTVVASISINRVAGGYSTAALAALSVANRVMEFPFAIILGFGQGYQPVVGFNWGAKRYDRVRGSFRFSSRTALIGGGVMGLAMALFAPQIIGWFSSGDPELVRLGTLCIRLQALALPIHAWVAIVNHLAGGLGKAKIALLLATARQGSCFIPILYPMSRIFGAEGIASVQAVADVLTLALAIPAMISIKKMIDSAETEENAVLMQQQV